MQRERVPNPPKRPSILSHEPASYHSVMPRGIIHREEQDCHGCYVHWSTSGVCDSLQGPGLPIRTGNVVDRALDAAQNKATQADWMSQPDRLDCGVASTGQ